MLGRQTDKGGISHLGQELYKTGLGVVDGLCGIEGTTAFVMLEDIEGLRA